jgi:hypothetical protein
MTREKDEFSGDWSSDLGLNRSMVLCGKHREVVPGSQPCGYAGRGQRQGLTVGMAIIGAHHVLVQHQQKNWIGQLP